MNDEIKRYLFFVVVVVVNCLNHLHDRIPFYFYPGKLDKKLQFCIKK